jgi:tetratricopeptide (TPR) repeat protein
MSQHLLPGSYEDLFFRGQAMAQTGETEQAVELFTRLVERLGRLSESVFARREGLRNVQLRACLELAGLLQAEGRYAEAIEVEGKLLQTHPDRSPVWRRDMAVLRMSSGAVDEGLRELRALADESPDDVWNWLVLANEARIEGRFAESQTSYAQALDAAGRTKEPEQDSKILAEIHFGRFRLYDAMGQLDEAVAEWDKALELEPTVKHTVRSVYQMLTTAGRYAQALEYVSRDENTLQAGFQRGIIAELTGKADEATKEFKAVAALDPMQFEQGHECWAEAVLRLKDPLPVLERLRQLLGQHGSLRLMVLAGIAWAMHGDKDLAQGLFEQSISLLKRSRPAKQKLDSADWRLLTALVADEGIRTALKPYFAVVERILE